MWSRHLSGAERRQDESAFDENCRRAYYRVTGSLPIRLTRLHANEVDGAIFDLSLPDPLLQPVAEPGDDTVLMERLRRIEDKLDLLLGASQVAFPKQLSGRDRKSLVFSGSGLALDVSWSFERGDAFRIELLLPPPHGRTVRAVATAVEDSPIHLAEGTSRQLALVLTHMEDEERDALVAYSYDLQRFALRTRNPAAPEPS